MNWELLFIISSASVLSFFSFLFGFAVATRFNVYTKISKKEDYEEKIKALEQMIDQMNQPIEEEKINYNPGEMFPPGVLPEYGLPRKL
jgi:hypothetical protein